MDANRFDAFTRALPGLPRRALAGLLGGGLAALLTGIVPGVASKKKKRRRRKKKRRQRKRRKKQRNEEPRLPCGPGTKACGATCVPSGDCCGGCGDQTCCDGACADLATDGANCGSCGTACFRNLCFNGACACSLAPDGGCAGGCECIPRLEGGFGCAAFGQPGAECTTDSDCAFGTFCANEQGNGNCSLPCSVT